ncbi:MAG: CBS domain-containing protein [Gammaproteobacteria bacterium]|nr:CBS domain-containing protein [Gammaproteobacteria bacterium]
MKSKQQIIRVRDIMKTTFVTIDRTATVSDALLAMKREKTAVLVVKPRDEDDEYGLLTAGDIAREVMALDRAPERVNVYEVMTKPVISLPPQMDIRYCARLFAHYHLIRAPVIEDRKVIGMVSPAGLVLDGLCALALNQNLPDQ